MNRYTASALACVLSAAAASPAWALPPAAHAYGFDGDTTDELGGPGMVPIQAAIRPTNLRFVAGGGATVSGAVAASTYSIEMRFKISVFNSFNGWTRLIDFKNRTADQGLYVHDGCVAFYTYDTFQAAQPVFVAGKVADLVITRDGATGQLDMYVNGVLQLSLVDSGNDAVFLAPDGTHTIAGFFQDDVVYGNEDAAGAVDHIRLFDTVLTQADARALARGQLPPNVSLY